jgi:predicted AlkP superfamily phosphohydrolase/phosphomutase
LTGRSQVGPNGAGRPPGAIAALLRTAVAFALLVGAYLGVAGVATSNFAISMSPSQLFPVAGLAFLVYLGAGALVAGANALGRKARSDTARLERRLVHVMAAVTLWAVLAVMFLPLKGTEASVQAGKLTTLQLNALAAAAIVVAGLVGGWIVAVVVGRVVALLRRRLTPGGTRALGAAGAAVCVVLLAVGPALTARDLSRLPLPEDLTPGKLPRVVLVAVDGCEWSVLGPLMESGELPTFKRLADGGSFGPLRTIEPILSPIIWTSMATGKLPDKHGIHGFVNEQNVPVNSRMRLASPVWDIVSGHGEEVCVVGWYVTWPADRVNGVLVSDRLHSLLRGPLQMYQSLTGRPTNERLEAFGEFVFDPGYKRYPKEEERFQLNRIVDEPLRWGYLRDRIYGKAATSLGPYYEPAFTAVYYRGVDFVQHFFWKFHDPNPFGEVEEQRIREYGDVIRSYYRYQDALLAQLLDSLGEDLNVVIVSDHGFTSRHEHPDPGRPQLTGEHRIDGVIIASGPAFREAGYFEGATVLDIAPTALAVMGLPVPEDMDGRVLEETISDEHLEQHPVTTIPSYEPAIGREGAEVGSTMDESIREQLRSLGYIE